MNPALAYTQNAEQVYLALGALQFFGLWVVSAVCSIGLVWVIGRWMDRQ